MLDSLPALLLQGGEGEAGLDLGLAAVVQGQMVVLDTVKRAVNRLLPVARARVRMAGDGVSRALVEQQPEAFQQLQLGQLQLTKVKGCRGGGGCVAKGRGILPGTCGHLPDPPGHTLGMVISSDPGPLMTSIKPLRETSIQSCSLFSLLALLKQNKRIPFYTEL